MKKANIVRFTLALAFLAATTSLTWSQERQPRQLPNGMNTIEGVWGVTRHGVNCDTGQDRGPSFPALITFHQDGTMLAQTYGPFPENAYGPAEMGVWQHGPGHTFSFRDLSYIYDDNGQFNGSGVVTATGQLTSANTFTYTATIQVYDADGNLLVTLCGRATATRFQ
jgi:hypothetical protein